MSVNLHYEDKARAAGFSSVCGVDEAGAGPLMGPVYAAAVILPEGCEIEGLNDSKKLTEKKREALFPVICEKAVAYAIASVEDVYKRQRTHTARDKAAAAPRMLLQLIVCGVLFVALVGLKLLLPGNLSALRGTLGQWLVRDADFVLSLIHI